MQAHIRFDLPRAEAWVFNSYYSQFPGARMADFRADFMSMAGVFDNAGRDMNGEMARRLGIPVDLMPALVQDTAMRSGIFDADMSTERADTWRRAEELQQSGLAGADPYKMGPGGGLTGDVTQSDNTSGLQGLPTTDLRPTMANSAPLDDNDVRGTLAGMDDAAIAALPLANRMRMIRALFKGYTGGADEACILRILNASRGPDLVTLIDGSDAWDLMYAIDGGNSRSLRAIFVSSYYGLTAQHTAMRLIRKCLDGETAEWEEQMVADILEAHPAGRAMIGELGLAYGGPAEGEDRDFKNGLYKLEWQLDGAEEGQVTAKFGESGLGWWNF